MSTIIEGIDESLVQRICILRDGIVKGKYVLYWMKHAVRAHENPALDVALQSSAKLSLPLLVYHEIAEDEPYASDRRFAFEIEGARDVQQELLLRSIDYLFYIQRRHANSLLEQLAGEAAVIVAEDMPVPSERVAKQRLIDNSTAPILLVDTACIVPMQVAGKPYTRAFAYRQATAKERASRLKAIYNEIDYRPAPLPKGIFAATQISLEQLDLKSLLAPLDIDCRRRCKSAEIQRGCSKNPFKFAWS
ncbi:hypothetical protein BH11CYA1_BH11CYA1_47650 [soil metagenome]